MIVRFRCLTKNKKNYYDIKNKVFLAKAALPREKVIDTSSEFKAELEILSYGRSLYRELDESGLCDGGIHIIDGTKEE